MLTIAILSVSLDFRAAVMHACTFPTRLGNFLNYIIAIAAAGLSWKSAELAHDIYNSYE